MERNYLPACYRQAFGKTKCQNRSPNGTEYSAPLREIIKKIRRGGGLPIGLLSLQRFHRQQARELPDEISFRLPYWEHLQERKLCPLFHRTSILSILFHIFSG